jgi:XTP/dITP diphosphohydrolase
VIRLEIYFATKNPHKFEEVSAIKPGDVEIKMLPSDVPDAPEAGDTFLENALSKAIFYSKILKAPVISDDSGLVIDSLKGFPGIFSSRFMEGEDYRRKMEKILKMMEDEKNRKAKFVCVAFFADVENGFVLSSKGEVHGSIAKEIRGSGGFGYDPIFIPERFDKTLGELGESVKNRISHRKRAFEKLFQYLRALT